MARVKTAARDGADRPGGMSAVVLVFGRRQRRDVPHAQLAGVQKAPRHEVAGSLAPAVQRALWGFNIGAALDGRRDASTRRRLHTGEPKRVRWASRRAR